MYVSQAYVIQQKQIATCSRTMWICLNHHFTFGSEHLRESFGLYVFFKEEIKMEIKIKAYFQRKLA